MILLDIDFEFEGLKFYTQYAKAVPGVLRGLGYDKISIPYAKTIFWYDKNTDLGRGNGKT